MAPSDPIRRGWRKQQSGPPWVQRCVCFPKLLSLLGANPLAAGVCGLAFLGFPLHPAGRPSQERAAHLFDVQIPMLFLQGTRDTLASLDQIEPLCKKLGKRATLKLFTDADHFFHVPARTGRKDAQVLGDMIDAFVTWFDDVIVPFVKKS